VVADVKTSKEAEAMFWHSIRRKTFANGRACPIPPIVLPWIIHERFQVYGEHIYDYNILVQENSFEEILCVIDVRPDVA
jgi:hypothetical protein